MLEVMRCLDEELRKSPAPDVKAYKVIRVLLEASINALEKGNQDPQTFDRATLLEICDPKVKAAGRPCALATNHHAGDIPGRPNEFDSETCGANGLEAFTGDRKQ